MSLINDLVVTCIRKCGNVVKLEKYGEHLSSNCRNCCENVNSPSKVTLRDVLSKPSTSPATSVEVRAAHHLVKRLLHQGEESSTSTSGRITSRSGIYLNRSHAITYKKYTHANFLGGVSFFLIGRAKRAPHWGVQSRFRVIYVGMSVVVQKA